MTDPRYERLAEVLTKHSTALQPGDKVLIDVSDIPDAMVIALIRAVRKAKALPFTQLQHSRVSREMAIGATGPQIGLAAEVEMARMKKMDVYIAIRGSDNATEMSDVPADKLKMIAATMRPVMNHRINKTRWVVLRWPSPSMAQQAQMSTEAFEDYYFRVCTLDYGKLRKGMEVLKALMDATDKVQIKGPTPTCSSASRISVRSFAAATAIFPRGSFHRAGQAQRRRQGPLQCSDHLSRHRLRGYRPRIQTGPDHQWHGRPQHVQTECHS